MSAIYIKPKKVLCKRTLTIGDPFYYDDLTGEKKECENRMLIKGVWYDVVPSPHDNHQTFSIIDSQNCRHLHYMYNEEDKKNWPSICKDYGPRDYAKWFYTPEELELKEKRAKTN